MGQAIIYCYRCSTQLREVQFEQGKAFRLDSRGCCANCAPEALRTLPPAAVKVLLTQLAAAQQRQIPTAPPPRRGTQAVPMAAPPAASKGPLWAASGVAAIVIVAVIVMSTGSSAPPPVPAGGPPARPMPDSKPALTPAARSLQKAREFARQSPNDLFAQLKFFEDPILQDDRTETGAEARRAAQEIRARGKEAVERAIGSLDNELVGALGREEFSAGFAQLEAAKSRMEWPEWKLAVDKRSREQQDRMDKLYEQIKEKAKSAKEKGNGPEIKVHLARVNKWGVQRLIDDLASALAAVSPQPVRVPIQDFEGDIPGWKYVGGEEHPGAKGSFTPDTTVVHAGRRAYKLDADFSKGGVYVGCWWDTTGLKERDVQEIRLWVKTPSISILGVRVADSTGQVHQKSAVMLRSTSDWQEVVLRISDLVGPEHWAGANDGRWHGPLTGFGVCLGHQGFRAAGAKSGSLWVDDIDVLTTPSTRDQ
jgi:hypothetical protein